MNKQSCEKCIALIGDPHLPGRNIELKKRVIEDINSWPDVDLVVCVGDLCATVGTEEEFAYAADFFAELHKPFVTLIGNHDICYSDTGYVRGSLAERQQKLERFKRNFSDTPLFHHYEFAGWRMIFLAVDDSQYYSSISARQLDWFAAVLHANKEQNTVVFCHAPLWSDRVLEYFPQAINYIAQPCARLKKIAGQNPQLKLWVSGHVHFGMKEELVKHPFNYFLNQVTNLITCDLDGFSVLNLKIRPEFHDNIWTRKLYLSKDSYRCTVFDHAAQKELLGLEMSGAI